MTWSLSRLRPLHIAVLSVAYWLGLTAVKLGSAILAAWWISRLPPGRGSISAGLDNTLLHLTMVTDGKPLWIGSVSIVTLIAWIVGPPLLLALTWRWTREVEAAGVPDVEPAVRGPADGSAPPLPEPPPPWRPDATRVVEARRPDASEPRTPPSGRAR